MRVCGFRLGLLEPVAMVMIASLRTPGCRLVCQLQLAAHQLEAEIVRAVRKQYLQQISVYTSKQNGMSSNSVCKGKPVSRLAHVSVMMRVTDRCGYDSHHQTRLGAEVESCP
jgi:hypothetical protein